MADHLPAARRLEEDLPPLFQAGYPAYQLDSVNTAEVRKTLASLLTEYSSSPLAVVLTSEPSQLAYRIQIDDIDALLLEMGRRGEFLCLISNDPPGELLLEPPEEEGNAPFWLSAAGSFESFVPLFAKRLPGGTLYTTRDFSLKGR